MDRREEEGSGPLPILVVTQGLPGSGKTEVSLYLERGLGFVRLSPEDWYNARLGPVGG